MRSEIIVLVAIATAAMMALSPMSFAHNAISNNEYKLGNFNISFNSGVAKIADMGHSFIQQWKLYEVNKTSLRQINLTMTKIIRINDTRQNTVGTLLTGNGFCLSAIYALGNYGKSLDMSVIVSNHNTWNATVETFYFLTMPYSATIFESGYEFSNLNTNSVGVYNRNVPINGNAWEITTANCLLSWESQLSTFSGGYTNSSILGTKAALAFGPYSLKRASSYFIDPTITPDKIIPPPGGGGGGSGGGGSTKTPISISSVSYSFTNSGTVSTIGAYSIINVKADVSSMGSYSVATINFYVVSETNPSVYIKIGSTTTSSTGWTTSVPWSAQPGSYTEFAANSQQSYGSYITIEPSYPVNVYTVFPALLGNNQISHPPDSYYSIKLYDQSQNFIGNLIEDLGQGPSFVLKDNTEYFVNVTTTVDQQSSPQYYVVNSYQQKINWVEDSLGDNSVHTSQFYPEYQNFDWQTMQNGSWGNSGEMWAEALYGAVAATFAADPTTVPVSVAMATMFPVFFDSGVSSLYSHSATVNEITASANASRSIWWDNGLPFLNRVNSEYYGIDKPIYLFSLEYGFHFANGYSGSYATADHAVLQYFSYTTHFDLLQNVSGSFTYYPNIPQYSFSFTMPFYMAAT